MRDPALGYARTFLRQAEDCLGLALEQGVRIVANAGGLNPAGLAEGSREVAAGLGLDPAVAHVEGDDVRALAEELRASTGALTANAYLGGFGIARRSAAGADIVVTGRVTDASLVVGPAIAHYGWTLDVLRRARRRGGRRPRHRVRHPGHRRQLLRLPRPAPRTGTPLGLPDRRDRRRRSQRDHQARRHRRRGHRRHRHRPAALRDPVDRATSTPTSPPASTSSSSRRRARTGSRVTGVRGEAPPERLKVCVNELGGYRNRRVRAHRPRHRGEGRLGARQLEPLADAPQAVTWTRSPSPPPRRGHRGGGVRAAALHRAGPGGRVGRPRRSPARRSSWRWRRTRASR